MNNSILDDSTVSEIEAQAWKKGFPDLDGDYYCRVDEYDKQPTLIRIESRSSTVRASVYECGCGDDLRREYEAEEEYEYLGPLTPESIPALCATVKHLRAENEALMKSLRDAYEFYMGPHACGDFTCECDQPQLCGICEIREATELALAKNMIDTSPVVNCNPSGT